MKDFGVELATPPDDTADYIVYMHVVLIADARQCVFNAPPAWQGGICV